MIVNEELEEIKKQIVLLDKLVVQEKKEFESANKELQNKINNFEEFLKRKSFDFSEI